MQQATAHCCQAFAGHDEATGDDMTPLASSFEILRSAVCLASSLKGGESPKGLPPPQQEALRLWVGASLRKFLVVRLTSYRDRFQAPFKVSRTFHCRHAGLPRVGSSEHAALQVYCLKHVNCRNPSPLSG